ncbi:MFS transporter [Streptomyces sp. RK75]|uniref:MDR family MFS transporter n=1 Tax=Streptomyces sp. RK75 TaxID=2824895 RepID=UPI001617A94B|nr:MFS transporter [Streptomyces sp. RK75]MBQ0868467.1 MFS transporter [Streptomyces sp. RK75]
MRRDRVARRGGGRLRPSLGTPSDIRALPPFVRLLAATQLAFNVGFFAVLPYLAAHLGGALEMGGWLVGLVLGLRTFSQQGLFVVGGALTDRWGPRPLVVAGCLLRIAGFVWLGYAQQTGSVIAAVLCVGFAAALFSPAVESETARQAVRHEQATGHPRARTLAVFSAAGQAGAFLGPLLGSLLLLADFRTACLAGAAVFVAVLAGHWRWMPRERPEAVRRGPDERGGAVRETARNGPFLLLCLAYGGYLLAYNQLYLALPEEVVRVTGSQAALGWLFALSSLLVVCAQLPVTRAAGARMGHRTALCAGLGVVAAGFLLVAAFAPVAPTGVVGLVPAAGYVLALTLGQMLTVPAARALVTELVPERRLGFSMGALSSLAGAVVLAGSAATGALLGTGAAPAAVWSVLACVPLLGAAAGRAIRVRSGTDTTRPGV